MNGADPRAPDGDDYNVIFALAETAALERAELVAALKSAGQEIAQLCIMTNICAKKAGLGRKVRAEDWGKKVRAAIAKATAP